MDLHGLQAADDATPDTKSERSSQLRRTTMRETRQRRGVALVHRDSHDCVDRRLVASDIMCDVADPDLHRILTCARCCATQLGAGWMTQLGVVVAKGYFCKTDRASDLLLGVCWLRVCSLRCHPGIILATGCSVAALGKGAGPSKLLRARLALVPQVVWNCIGYGEGSSRVACGPGERTGDSLLTVGARTARLRHQGRSNIGDTARFTTSCNQSLPLRF